MKVVVTFDVDEKSLDDLVVMAKVYRKKDGYKEFVSVENNLPLRPLPQKKEIEVNEIDDIMHTEYSIEDIYTNKYIATILLETDKLISLGYNACLDDIMEKKNDF